MTIATDNMAEHPGYSQLLLASMRPHQWVKNLFVLAPLVFSQNLTSPGHIQFALYAFAAFCLAAGAVYLVNDIVDRELDRYHPTKKARPIASGRLPLNVALGAAILVSLGVAAGALIVGVEFFGILLGYLLLNVAYSQWLKHVPYVDVSCIAAGFILRVLGGAAAIDVVVSGWLILCTALLALVLGLGKRAHELRMIKDKGPTRQVLRLYSLAVVRWLLAALSVLTVVAYAAYTQADRTVSMFDTNDLIYTTPFCAIGIALYFRHALLSKNALPPTEAMLGDKLFLANLGVWGLLVVTLMY